MYITVINGSPRKNGNTEIISETFAEGARENGHTVVVKNLSEIAVGPCLACEYCFDHEGQCIQKDGMEEIMEEVNQSDMVVFASPIYWFCMTAQLKAVIDRFYAKAQKGLKPQYAALILDSASPDVYESAIIQYKEMIQYLHWQNKGIITIANMECKGSMWNSPELIDVREFGKNI